MTGLSAADMLSRLEASEAKAKPSTPSKPSGKATSLSDMAGMLAALNQELEQDDPRKIRRAKFAAKKAELKEGGKREGAKDWVTSKCESFQPDILIPPTKSQAPIIPPKPVAERSVEELYLLLVERVRRYVKIVTEDKPDRVPVEAWNPKKALDNATEIANLLEERGETSEQIVAFIQSKQEGGEDK